MRLNLPHLNPKIDCWATKKEFDAAGTGGSTQIFAFGGVAGEHFGAKPTFGDSKAAKFSGGSQPTGS